MAFGQQSGPPASARQLKELAGLLEAAGYAGFRDARGPLGFTQRQGGGKFTSEEAAAFIEQLEQGEANGGGEDDGPPVAPPRAVRPARPAPVTRAAPPNAIAVERREARLAASAKALPPHVLARELERQGWILIPPDGYVPPEPPPAP